MTDSPLIESIVAEFDAKYDFSESKTLEYDNLIGIADFLREKFTLSIAEGERKAAESIKQQILNASYLVEGSWKHEYVRGLGAAEKIAADYLKQASHPSYEK